ncbi:MoxR family ATPase [Caballeronia sp. dw_19]|uniref:AAA family ATPase n=1 Tax=Caballeronia sp. dw_19 TaxID=2719791 RepID=UPI001BD45656|nr:MoxR family ATPase [Caballeronia sp. dw_19]
MNDTITRQQRSEAASVESDARTTSGGDALLREQLQRAGYIADEGLAAVMWLACELQRPLLVEGDAGVGKTALAIALARAEGRRLVRLQCHEGLDLSQAAYEWNYGRQLLAIRVLEAQAAIVNESDLFSRDYLLERPLLQAISSDVPCVLLIDEIDRADEAFEAFLLEVLSDYQISVPELGTVRARYVPRVLLTSNGTRELSDALRRRCLFHWLDYPTLAREIAIVRSAVPTAEGALVEQAVGFVQRLRKEDLGKTPGVAETLDWVRALHRMRMEALPDDPHGLTATLGCLLKTRDDLFQLTPEHVQKLIDGRRTEGVAVKTAQSSSGIADGHCAALP